jgi:hypothetical protein
MLHRGYHGLDRYLIVESGGYEMAKRIDWYYHRNG